MKKVLLLITICIGLSIFFYPTISNTENNGSPGEMTNSPLDGQNCTSCHSGTINSGGGTATITHNIPLTGYIVGNAYTITLTGFEFGCAKFGFELTAEDSISKVGTFLITNSTETKYATGTNNAAVTHKLAGTSGNTTKSWAMDWIAAATINNSTTFYASLIFANNNNQNTLDNVSTTSLLVIEDTQTPSWDCNPVQGCFDPGTGQGLYASLSACQMACITTSQSWNCINGACIVPSTGIGLYLTLATCQMACFIPTWDCINNSCIDPGTGAGAHSTLADCQNNCVITPTWNCDGQGNCLDPGTGIGYFTDLALCNASCALSWDCDLSTGICSDPGTGLGAYSTLLACQTACLAGTWDCDQSTGICSDPGTGLGAHSTLLACQTACAGTWDCDPSTGICSDPGTGLGAYTSFADCQLSCITAINEEISNLLIYPNPIKNTLTIDGNYTSATIYNVFGTIVLITDYQNTIDVASLNNGVYFIHINTNSSSAVKKIIIAK